jgi:hypothetical protein
VGKHLSKLTLDYRLSKGRNSAGPNGAYFKNFGTAILGLKSESFERSSGRPMTEDFFDFDHLDKESERYAAANNGAVHGGHSSGGISFWSVLPLH